MNYQSFRRPSAADLFTQLAALINTLEMMDPEQAAHALERYPGLAVLRDQLQRECTHPPDDRVSVSVWIRSLKEDCAEVSSARDETTAH